MLQVNQNSSGSISFSAVALSDLCQNALLFPLQRKWKHDGEGRFSRAWVHLVSDGGDTPVYNWRLVITQPVFQVPSIVGQGRDHGRNKQEQE